MTCAASFIFRPAPHYLATTKPVVEWLAMNPSDLDHRYRELQAYLGWCDADSQRVQAIAERMEPVHQVRRE